jgi:ankyrin repeat protein
MSKESEYEDEIERLRKQLEAANRKLTNANHQKQASQKAARDALLNEAISKKEAAKYKSELCRTRDRYQTLEHDLQINKLRNECAKDKTSILRLRATINEIENDPKKDLPIKVNEKQRLPRLKLELQRLKAKHESQSQLLESIEQMGDMNDALRQAASRGDTTMTKRLLSRGVRVNVPDETGYTAFMYACGQGHAEIADLMMSIGDAIVNDADAKLTPLILACTNSHDETIQLLLKNGAVIDQKDELGYTPLLITCEKNSLPCAKTLLEAGANPNSTDRRGNSPLHHCAVSGNADLAKLLLRHGANSTLKNNDFMTAVGKFPSKARNFGCLI